MAFSRSSGDSHTNLTSDVNHPFIVVGINLCDILFYIDGSNNIHFAWVHLVGIISSIIGTSLERSSTVKQVAIKLSIPFTELTNLRMIMVNLIYTTVAVITKVSFYIIYSSLNSRCCHLQSILMEFCNLCYSYRVVFKAYIES